MAFPPRPPRGAFNPRFRKEQQQEHRTNHMIKVPEVRLVGDNVQPGIFTFQEALKIAQQQELDLVEISPEQIHLFAKSLTTISFFTKRRRKKRK